MRPRGATQVECTVNGIGERAGNASLEEIVMALRTRKDFYDAETGVNTKQIYRSSKLLSNITACPSRRARPSSARTPSRTSRASISTASLPMQERTRS